jgi:peroxiredoxin
MPEVGQTAPDFVLYDAEKKETKLSDFLGKGKRTVLAFYPGAFTGTCTTELCTFRDMMGEFGKLSGQVIGVSVDSPFANKGFAEKNGLKFPLLSDFKREVIQKYDVTWKGLGGLKGYESANRAVFVLDERGKITYRWVASDPGQLPNFEEVKKALR